MVSEYWEPPTMEIPRIKVVTVTSHISNYDGIVQALLLVVDLRRRDRLEGASIHVEPRDGPVTFSIRITPDNLAELRRNWPGEFTVTDIEEGGPDDLSVDAREPGEGAAFGGGVETTEAGG